MPIASEYGCCFLKHAANQWTTFYAWAITGKVASPRMVFSRVKWEPQLREVAMPTYQYRCNDCGEKFERSETISQHEASKAKCVKCGSKKVSQVPGNVFVVTSKKS